MSRLFVFGCSYTNYAYPTWADLISPNFTQYYNYGKSGCSNTFIMDSIVAANDTYKFKRSDTVIVMLTGFGRFSYKPKGTIWQAKGDMYNYCLQIKDPVVQNFYDNMWSDEFAVHQSWIAAKVIKQILAASKCNHKILMGISNDAYISGLVDLEISMYKKAMEIYSMLDNKVSLDKWKMDNNYYDSPMWEEKGGRDGHPSTDVYLKYAKEFLPHLVSKKSLQFVKYWNKNFDHRSQAHMEEKFSKEFKAKHDLGYINKLLV